MLVRLIREGRIGAKGGRSEGPVGTLEYTLLRGEGTRTQSFGLIDYRLIVASPERSPLRPGVPMESDV